MGKLLTVIITLRATTAYNMAERLAYRLLDTAIPDEIEFMVVDDGSPEPDATQIKKCCHQLGFKYVHHNSGKLNFCASSSRNLGAMLAETKFIMHEDVDLFPYPGFYKDLLAEIDIQKLNEDSRRFITVPCFYLSEDATKRAVIGDISKNQILHSYLIGGGDVVTCLPSSSVVLINRLHYLSIGGYNEEFNGWGVEDLDYAYRLTRDLNAFLTPREPTFLIEGGYSTFSAYRGWRSQFRLHGDLLARKGIVIFHANHPKDAVWRNKDSHAKNKRVFLAGVRQFEKKGHTLPPLFAPEKGKSLIFGKGTFAYNRALLPLWGELEVKGYQDFQSLDIVKYCKVNEINRVIFTNPYASEQRLNVYQKVRDSKIPYLVVERGALPDSMFIDDTGFCCESIRYRREYWPKFLDEKRLQNVLSYIEEQTASSYALEDQGGRLGKRGALEKLGIHSSKKVLFVPFQSRSDTTVTYFAGKIESYDNFVALVREVVSHLDHDWVVLFKNHPLSSVCEEVPGAIDVGNMHINDVLEVTDYTLLMNSGVGVLSALFGKPVIHTAQAFYSDLGLNREASTVNEVIDILTTGFSVCRDSQLRFFSYLIEDFYSFGTFKVRKKKYSDQADLTITDHIDYYRVNILGERFYEKNDQEKIVSHRLPIYDIFREWIINDKKSALASSNSSTSNAIELNNGSSKESIRARGSMCKLFVRPFVALSSSRASLRKFDKSPASYFRDTKSSFWKKFGKLLFG